MERAEKLLALHQRVDQRARALAAHHSSRLHCRRGCAGCCVDGLTVFEVEVDRIRLRHRELLENGRPHPSGTCAFLDDDGACRVYHERPYVCRTQGLPLRFFGEHEDGGTVEYRDICPLNEEGPSLEELDESECWTIGPTEGELALLQAAASGSPSRVALRDLFHGGSDSG